MLTATTFLRERGVYLWLAFLMPPLSIFGHALAPGRAVFKGQDLGIWIGIVLAGLSLLAWLPYRSTTRLGWLPLSFLGVVGATWLVLVVRIQLDQSLFAWTTFCVPVFVLLIALKPPRREDVVIAGLALAYGLGLIALVSIPLGAIGAMPTGFDTALCRLPVICDLTGSLPRWAGPFGNVNYSAPIGGLLIIFGASQRRVHAWPIVTVGIIIVMLSQGRSGLFAVAVALVILVLWGRRVSASANAWRIRIVTIAVLGLVYLVFILTVDRTVNGRTGIWPQFVDLWRTSPLTGVGDSGVQAYIDSRPVGVPTYSHAHNVVLDILVRWGLLLALATLAIYALALVAGVKGLRSIGPGPMAVVAFVICSGLVETVHSWDYWTPYLAMLTWATLIVTVQQRGPRVAGEPPGVSASSIS